MQISTKNVGVFSLSLLFSCMSLAQSSVASDNGGVTTTKITKPDGQQSQQFAESADSSSSSIFEKYKIEAFSSDSEALGATRAAPFTQYNEFSRKFNINLPSFGPAGLSVSPKYRLPNREWDKNVFNLYEHNELSELGWDWSINPFGFLVTAPMGPTFDVRRGNYRRFEEVALVDDGLNRFTRDLTFREDTVNCGGDIPQNGEVADCEQATGPLRPFTRDAHFIDAQMNRLTRDYDAAFGQSYYYLLKPDGTKITFAPEYNIGPQPGNPLNYDTYAYNVNTLRYYPVKVEYPNGRFIEISYRASDMTYETHPAVPGMTYTNGRHISMITDMEGRSLYFNYARVNGNGTPWRLDNITLGHGVNSAQCQWGNGVNGTGENASCAQLVKFDYQSAQPYLLDRVQTPEGNAFKVDYGSPLNDMPRGPVDTLTTPQGGDIRYQFEGFERQRYSVVGESTPGAICDDEAGANLCVKLDSVPDARLTSVTHSGNTYHYNYESCTDYLSACYSSASARFRVTVNDLANSYSRATDYFSKLDYIPDFSNGSSREIWQNLRRAELTRESEPVHGKKYHREESYTFVNPISGQSETTTRIEKWDYHNKVATSQRILGSRGGDDTVLESPIKSYSIKRDGYWFHTTFKYNFANAYSAPTDILLYQSLNDSAVDPDDIPAYPNGSNVQKIHNEYLSKTPGGLLSFDALDAQNTPYWLAVNSETESSTKPSTQLAFDLNRSIATTYDSQRPMPLSVTKQAHQGTVASTLSSSMTYYPWCSEPNSNDASCGQVHTITPNSDVSKKLTFSNYQFGIAKTTDHPGSGLKPDTLRTVNLFGDVISTTSDNVISVMAYDGDRREVSSGVSGLHTAKMYYHDVAIDCVSDCQASVASYMQANGSTLSTKASVSDMWGRNISSITDYARNASPSEQQDCASSESCGKKEQAYNAIGLVERVTNSDGTSVVKAVDIFGRDRYSVLYDSNGSVSRKTTFAYSLSNNGDATVETSVDDLSAGENIASKTKTDWLGRVIYQGVQEPGQPYVGTAYKHSRIGSGNITHGVEAEFTGAYKAEILPFQEGTLNSPALNEQRYTVTDHFGRTLLDHQPEEGSTIYAVYNDQGEMTNSIRRRDSDNAIIENHQYSYDDLERILSITDTVSNKLLKTFEYNSATGANSDNSAGGNGAAQLYRAKEFDSDGSYISKTYTYDAYNRVVDVITEVVEVNTTPQNSYPADATVLTQSDNNTLTLQWNDNDAGQAGKFFQFELQDMTAGLPAMRYPFSVIGQHVSQTTNKQSYTVNTGNINTIISQSANLSAADKSAYQQLLAASSDYLLHPSNNYRWRVRSVSKDWKPSDWSNWNLFAFSEQAPEPPEEQHGYDVECFPLNIGCNWQTTTLTEALRNLKITNTGNVAMTYHLSASTLSGQMSSFNLPPLASPVTLNGENEDGSTASIDIGFPTASTAVGVTHKVNLCVNVTAPEVSQQCVILTGQVDQTGAAVLSVSNVSPIIASPNSSGSFEVTFNNTGHDDSVFEQVTASGSYSQNGITFSAPQPATFANVGANEPHSFVVNYQVGNVNPGANANYNIAISGQSELSNPTVNVPVALSVASEPANLELSANSIDFGEVIASGQVSHALYINNIGGATTSRPNIGNLPQYFSINWGESCGATIAAGESCELNVVFNAPSSSLGQVNEQLSIPLNGGNEVVDLTAQVVTGSWRQVVLLAQSGAPIEYPNNFHLGTYVAPSTGRIPVKLKVKNNTGLALEYHVVFEQDLYANASGSSSNDRISANYSMATDGVSEFDAFLQFDNSRSIKYTVHYSYGGISGSQVVIGTYDEAAFSFDFDLDVYNSSPTEIAMNTVGQLFSEGRAQLDSLQISGINHNIDVQVTGTGDVRAVFDDLDNKMTLIPGVSYDRVAVLLTLVSGTQGIDSGEWSGEVCVKEIDPTNSIPESELLAVCKPVAGTFDNFSLNYSVPSVVFSSDQRTNTIKLHNNLQHQDIAGNISIGQPFYLDTTGLLQVECINQDEARCSTARYTSLMSSTDIEIPVYIGTETPGGYSAEVALSVDPLTPDAAAQMFSKPIKGMVAMPVQFNTATLGTTFVGQTLPNSLSYTITNGGNADAFVSLVIANNEQAPAAIYNLQGDIANILVPAGSSVSGDLSAKVAALGEQTSSICYSYKLSDDDERQSLSQCRNDFSSKGLDRVTLTLPNLDDMFLWINHEPDSISREITLTKHVSNVSGTLSVPWPYLIEGQASLSIDNLPQTSELTLSFAGVAQGRFYRDITLQTNPLSGVPLHLGETYTYGLSAGRDYLEQKFSTLANLDFGSVNVNDGGKVLPLSISNDSLLPMDIDLSGIGCTGIFRLSECITTVRIERQSSVQLSVEYHPQASGNNGDIDTASIQMSYEHIDGHITPLSTTALRGEKLIDISPVVMTDTDGSEVNPWFADVGIDDTSLSQMTKTYRIVNGSPNTQSFTVELESLMGQASSWSTNVNHVVTLPALGAIDIDVTFDPQFLGAQSARLVLASQSNGYVVNSAYVLHGRAVQPEVDLPYIPRGFLVPQEIFNVGQTLNIVYPIKKQFIGSAVGFASTDDVNVVIGQEGDTCINDLPFALSNNPQCRSSFVDADFNQGENGDLVYIPLAITLADVGPVYHSYKFEINLMTRNGDFITRSYHFRLIANKSTPELGIDHCSAASDTCVLDFSQSLPGDTKTFVLRNTQSDDYSILKGSLDLQSSGFEIVEVERQFNLQNGEYLTFTVKLVTEDAVPSTIEFSSNEPSRSQDKTILLTTDKAMPDKVRVYLPSLGFPIMAERNN